MISKEEVKGWILEYACKHKLDNVIQAISISQQKNLSALGVPHIWLSCAALHSIVYKEELSEFDVAIQIIDAIFSAFPNVIPFRLYARLIIGLKIKALFDFLKKDSDDILKKLNEYFPRSGLTHPKANPKLLSQINHGQKNFRKFFLSLVANSNQCRAYLTEEYFEDYGPAFMKSVQNLMGMVLKLLETPLPLTQLEKFLNLEGKLDSQYCSSPSVALEILLDYTQNKETLSAHDLLEMLTLLSPIYTQDQLQIDHHIHFSPELCSDVMPYKASQSDGSLVCSQLTPEGVSQSEDLRQENGVDSSIKVVGRSLFSSKSTSIQSQSLLLKKCVTKPVCCQQPRDQKEEVAAAGSSSPQVYSISSSSENIPTQEDLCTTTQTDGDDPLLCNSKDANVHKEVPASDANGNICHPLISSCNVNHSGSPKKQKYIDTSDVELMQILPIPETYSSCSNIDDTSSESDLSTIIPSSWKDERDNFYYDTDSDEIGIPIYPHIKQYKKKSCVKLCVVKLFRCFEYFDMNSGINHKIYT